MNFRPPFPCLRTNEGAGAQCERYNAALMDANETVSDQKKIVLPETYVIFITENDIYGEGLGIYKIDRYINGAKPGASQAAPA